MTAARYVVEFRFDDGSIAYAGKHKGALGWAPTIATALIFDSAESAGRHAANGYGAAAPYAHVMRLDDDGEPQEIDA